MSDTLTSSSASPPSLSVTSSTTVSTVASSTPLQTSSKPVSKVSKVSKHVDYKTAVSFELRQAESKRILLKYPDRVPVILQAGATLNNVVIDKYKFLVPNDVTVGQFMSIVRNRIKLTSDEAIFLFVNNTLPSSSALMSQIYKEHADPCGFLFFVITSESTFGSSN